MLDHLHRNSVYGDAATVQYSLRLDHLENMEMIDNAHRENMLKEENAQEIRLKELNNNHEREMTQLRGALGIQADHSRRIDEMKRKEIEGEINNKRAEIEVKNRAEQKRLDNERAKDRDDHEKDMQQIAYDHSENLERIKQEGRKNERIRR